MRWAVRSRPAAGWRTCAHVHLEITGEDLLAAGVPEGPEIGRRLEAVLELRLDGELADGREAELGAALELADARANERGRAGVSAAELSFDLPGGGRVLFTTRAHGNLSSVGGEGPSTAWSHENDCASRSAWDVCYVAIRSTARPCSG